MHSLVRPPPAPHEKWTCVRYYVHQHQGQSKKCPGTCRTMPWSWTQSKRWSPWDMEQMILHRLDQFVVVEAMSFWSEMAAQKLAGDGDTERKVCHLVWAIVRQNSPARHDFKPPVVGRESNPACWRTASNQRGSSIGESKLHAMLVLAIVRRIFAGCGGSQLVVRKTVSLRSPDSLGYITSPAKYAFRCSLVSIHCTAWLTKWRILQWRCTSVESPVRARIRVDLASHSGSFRWLSIKPVPHHPAQLHWLTLWPILGCDPIPARHTRTKDATIKTQKKTYNNQRLKHLKEVISTIVEVNKCPKYNTGRRSQSKN